MIESDKTDAQRPEQVEKPAEDLAGLYDGFDAYRTATEANYRNLLTAGLVVGQFESGRLSRQHMSHPPSGNR